MGYGDHVTAWRKSSYSTDSGNCVEVAFRRSSHSANNVSCVEVAIDYRRSSHCSTSVNCVEVAAGDGRVLVRDSKDPDGPVLEFSPAAWTAFVAAVREGALGG